METMDVIVVAKDSRRKVLLAQILVISKWRGREGFIWQDGQRSAWSCLLDGGGSLELAHCFQNALAPHGNGRRE